MDLIAGDLRPIGAAVVRERSAFCIEQLNPQVPVGYKGKRLLFLQAGAWVDPARRAPCLIYTAHYADGETVDVPVREGIDIGAFDAPTDLTNWQVVWTAQSFAAR